MPDAELTVDVDTSAVDDAADAFREVVDAIEELEERGINVSIDSELKSGVPADAEVMAVDDAVASDVGDQLAAEVAARRADVDADDVLVFALEAPNRVRYRVTSSVSSDQDDQDGEPAE